MSQTSFSKFYIASSSAFIDECKELASKLEGKGVTITRKWWNEYVKGNTPELDNLTDQEWYDHPRIQKIKSADFEAIKEAEALILISHYPKALTGALVEVGYALALNKPVFVIGELKKSAMFTDCLFFVDWRHFLVWADVNGFVVEEI